MSQLSPHRKRVVLLCAAVTSMGGGSVLLKGHPVLLGAWIGLMVVTLAFAMVELAKLRRNGR